MRARYGQDIPMTAHPYIRSEEACFLSSALAVDLARRFNTQLHLLHLTTARETTLLSEGAVDSKRISAEVCVHHLFRRR